MSTSQICKIGNYDSSKPIRIWFGNLAKYNEGRLVGSWLSLPMVEEDLKGAISQILGNDEEWILNDSECLISGLEIHESSDPLKLNELAKIFEKLDGDEVLKVSHLLDLGHSVEEALEHYEDVMVYPGMDIVNVAEQLVEDGCFGTIPESIACYIDYERIARDLGFDGYHYDSESKTTYHYLN